MSETLTDLEYAEMLVDANESIFWHSMPRNPKEGEISGLIKDALWRAVRQALNDRGGMALPIERPSETGSSS